MNLRNAFGKKAAIALAGVAVGLTATASVAVAHDHDAVRSGPRTYQIGLWGDMPYAKNGDSAGVQAVIDSMNGQRLSFSVFDGDIKDGSSACTDDQYTAAVARFDQLKAPAVYVPGDNEWTDCHRTNNGGYDNLERLSFLRQTMFSQEESFGRHTMDLEHQGALGGPYSENTRWIQGDVVFVTLNVPGSDNNKVTSDSDCPKKSARTLEQCAADNAEYAERDAKNVEWLQQSFAKAAARHAKGVMVVIQADPNFDIPITEDINERANPAVDGYTNLLTKLSTETQAFAGQVVLVHGDTHTFVVDKPMAASLSTQLPSASVLPNFTRVGTFGSPEMGWVRVTIDPNSPNVFTFEPMAVSTN